ncbi:hypothetical protein C0J52_27301 [Blattella germanica]|nr:hypothetical protein C0J52_27301 [Blattella germanica]
MQGLWGELLFEWVYNVIFAGGESTPNCSNVSRLMEHGSETSRSRNDDQLTRGEDDSVETWAYAVTPNATTQRLMWLSLYDTRQFQAASVGVNKKLQNKENKITFPTVQDSSRSEIGNFSANLSSISFFAENPTTVSQATIHFPGGTSHFSDRDFNTAAFEYHSNPCPCFPSGGSVARAQLGPATPASSSSSSWREDRRPGCLAFREVTVDSLLKHEFMSGFVKLLSTPYSRLSNVVPSPISAYILANLTNGIEDIEISMECEFFIAGRPLLFGLASENTII